MLYVNFLSKPLCNLLWASSSSSSAVNLPAKLWIFRICFINSIFYLLSGICSLHFDHFPLPSFEIYFSTAGVGRWVGRPPSGIFLSLIPKRCSFRPFPRFFSFNFTQFFLPNFIFSPNFFIFFFSAIIFFYPPPTIVFCIIYIPVLYCVSKK